MNNILSRIWYPFFMSAAIVTFFVMLEKNAPVLIAAYIPIVITGLLIVLLERYFPETPDWHPTSLDIKTDTAFMALIQVVMPRLLSPAAAILLVGWVHDWSRKVLWPHEWPLAAQIVLMVLVVDFLRYWLHRACHRYMFLWRLHEVHHSPDILYIVNVARFHPLEKLLHFVCDTVPFILLGVAPSVIAGYFLLYSVNGFFQHSNLQLHYGWLNYVMGTAETHRWHHARDPKLASCNFGSSTILWDLLFGTWSLPGRMATNDIGIMDRGYPKSFWAQLIAPFRRHGGEQN